MVRKVISFLVFVFFISSAALSQSIADGIDAYYSGKPYSAIAILKNHANIPEGAYWLSQIYMDEERGADARQIISSALSVHPDNPWLLVKKGEFLLIDGKKNEARQSFQMAIINSTSRKKKNPAILNAVGKAIVDVYNNKNLDIDYGIAQLKDALKITRSEKKKRDNHLLADIYTNLGDAYRKSRPGEGSLAFVNYRDALYADPGFAQAEFRKGLIFKSQRNYDLFLKSMKDAIKANSEFLPAYYQIYYYKLGTQDYSGAQSLAQQIIKHSPNDPNNEYFAAQTFYIDKKYDDAITSANSVINKAGESVNPMAYKLIAYSYIDKGDTSKAVDYVDKYFLKVKKSDIVPKDYSLMAVAYSAIPGNEAEIIDIYLKGVEADTTLQGKLELLEDGSKLLGSLKMYNQQGVLYNKILELKSADKLVINDYFNAGLSYYRAQLYQLSWNYFDKIRTKYPDKSYGYLWTFLNSSIYDSVNAKNISVSDAEKYIQFSKTDTTAEKAYIYRAAMFLAVYYANIAKDNEKSVANFKTAYNVAEDTAAKEQIQTYIDILSGKKE